MNPVFHDEHASAQTFSFPVLAQIAAILDDAHRQGKVHGDFNPEHIRVVDAAPSVHITGFDRDASADASLLSGEAPSDSAFYLSPERILGTELTPQSDEFSFAVLAYRSVTGRLPFIAPTAVDLFHRICTDAPPVADLAPRTAEVFQRALAKDASARYTSCTELLEELRPSISDRAVPAAGFVLPRADAPPVLPPSPVIDRQRRRLGIHQSPDPAQPRSSLRRLILLAAVIVVAAVLILLASRQHPSPPAIPQQTLNTQSGPTVPPPQSAQPGPPAQSVAPQRKPPLQPPTESAPPLTPQPEAVPVPASINVHFNGDPAGSVVEVDHDPAQSCLTPCTLMLPSGRHTFTASMEGYRRQQGIFHLPEDTEVNIPLSPAIGALIITSDPPGAQVMIDGQPYGATPANAKLSSGVHQVTVDLDGQQQQASIRILADSIQAKSFVFR